MSSGHTSIFVVAVSVVLLEESKSCFRRFAFIDTAAGECERWFLEAHHVFRTFRAQPGVGSGDDDGLPSQIAGWKW